MSRAGFVAVLGRPNVGKSTLVNQLVGAKVTITAASPNTTRHAVRGILTEDDIQVVLVDTPGLHRPRTTLGGRLNETARSSVDGVDVILAVVDASAAIGPGDRQVIETMLAQARPSAGPALVVVVNKIDRPGREAVASQLLEASAAVEEVAREIGRSSVAADIEYFPVSAKTGEGTKALLAYLFERMPESPFLFPDEEVSDVTEATWIAELVREQLVRKTKQELPHSIHCRVSEFEWPHVTVEILVERESQKGMVIGKGGQLLKDVGIAARRQLPEGLYLELRVKVEPGWQKRDDVLDRFGY
ncbi:MAG TPA: GTPase Era [Acidimicrobiales bacterium]|jgi:GTP-binding protein Era|nr:GTPase Era [Acidimicrobiales bacterium]